MALGENRYHGGLLRFDMSPKPAFYKLRELLQERWHTEAEVISDAGGCAGFRGFYGDYEVAIETNQGVTTKTVTLSKNGENSFTLVI